MNDELKKKLAEHKKEKRARTCLLKDLSAIDVLVLIDRAEEHRGLRTDTPNLKLVRCSYLSRATAEQIDALRSRLPHITATVRSRVGPREVCCFDAAAIEAIFGDVLTTPSKYIRTFRKPFLGCTWVGLTCKPTGGLSNAV